MKIGFTGTQVGLTREQYNVLYNLLQPGLVEEFHHGDCIGADAAAHDIAWATGIRIVLHPPINSDKRAFKAGHAAFRAREYLDRNHDIVDVTDQLIATPKAMVEELRSGTWATVRYARKRHKPIVIIWPDGSLTMEGSQ